MKKSDFYKLISLGYLVSWEISVEKEVWEEIVTLKLIERVPVIPKENILLCIQLNNVFVKYPFI